MEIRLAASTLNTVRRVEQATVLVIDVINYGCKDELVLARPKLAIDRGSVTASRCNEDATVFYFGGALTVSLFDSTNQDTYSNSGKDSADWSRWKAPQQSRRLQFIGGIGDTKTVSTEAMPVASHGSLQRRRRSVRG